VGTVQAPASGSVHPDQFAGRSSRGRGRDESGSVLVLFSIFLTLFLVCCAVVVDVGYWWANGKKAQVAADACALAAAQSIPAINPSSGQPDPSTGECVIEAGGPDFVFENIPVQDADTREPLWTGTVVEWPYVTADGPDPTQVEATVHMKVGTFFGRIVGLHGVNVTRRAVAERQVGGPGNYAIYSHSPNCPNDPDFPGESLRFNGNEHSINGRVHSNGQFKINNGGAEPFWALIGTNVFCGEELDPAQAMRFFGPSYAESDEFLPRPVDEYNEDGILDYEHWPEWWTPSQFGWTSGCTYSGQKIEIDDTKLKITGRSDQTLPIVNGRRTIPTGTYCATELFKIGGNNLTGEFTALAREINVANGNDNDFKHAPGAPGNLMLFLVPNTDTNPNNDGGVDGRGTLTCSTEAKEKKMEVYNGNNGQWEGKIFNPCGLIQIDGNSTSSIRGAIYGYQVHVNGNGFNMIGEGGGGGGQIDLALTE
jgi:Putative Flp pilus-assembly TadE/G-like